MESPHNSQKQVCVYVCCNWERDSYIYIYTVKDKIISPPQLHFNTFSNIS